MDDAMARRRVAEARVGRLGTVRGDGSPRLVPCCFALVEDRVYTAVDDVKPKSTSRLGRLDDIRAHPQASLLVDHYDDDWSQLWWVRLDAQAAVLDVGDQAGAVGLEALVDKYDQYRRQPPPGPVMVLDVVRWLTWP